MASTAALPDRSAASASRWLAAVPVRAALACMTTAAAAAMAASGWPALSAPAAVAGLVVLAGAAGWWLRPTSESTGPAEAPVVVAPSTPAAELARQVVPVWQRSVEAARAHAEAEASTLMESFARVSTHLDLALAATTDAPMLDMMAIDEIIERHRSELDLLQADTRQALDIARRVMDQLGQVGDSVASMTTLANQVQGIARATHMLALNASVEATRAGPAGTGFAVVARDVGELAGQSRQASTQIALQVKQVRERIADLQLSRHDLDLDDEDLSLRAEAHARAAINALVGSLGESARNSRTLREAGRQAQADVDNIMMSLQSQDRLNQMLQSVTGDMVRLERWLSGDPDEAARSAADWLGRLEASYTMEDLRSVHHGTARIEQQAGVEFF